MLLALIALAALPDLVPARWISADPATLDLLRDTPVNCLLIEQPQWSAAFNGTAAERGVATLAVLRSDNAVASAKKAVELRFSGAVLEGAFPAAVRTEVRSVLAAAKMSAIELPPRDGLRFNSNDAVIGTSQGLWPGVQEGGEDTHKAAPSGAAWIDTNTGFLRFVRAASDAAVWIAVTPKPGTKLAPERYLQAIGDAAMTGARWVVSLDDATARGLMERKPSDLATWKRIATTLRYFEEHKEWRAAQPFARLALIENPDSGALLSGGILDMIAVKHTPVRPLPPQRLDTQSIAGARMAVNVDPEALSPEQREVLKGFTRSGGTLLTGPPGWKFPQPRPGQITLSKEDLGKLDEIWRELNAMTGRRNLGARLFNVSTMLSNLLESRDQKQVYLHLVNYSDYPVENVTVHVLGHYRSAKILRPDGEAKPLTGYDVDDGTGFDIDQVGSAATLVLER